MNGHIDGPTSGPIDGERLSAAILPAARPELIAVWDRVASTNSLAKELAHDGSVGHGVFVAREQTGGRGRGDREFVSPVGGIYLSVLFEASADPLRRGLLPIAAGVAAAEALREVAAVRTVVRWPNDLDGPRGKLGGVLVEAGFAPGRPSLVVAGFGINVGTAPVAGADALPPDTCREAVVAGIVTALHLARRLPPDEIAARWNRLSPTGSGCPCAVRLTGGDQLLGETAGLDPTGAIRVRAGGAVRVIHASDAVVFRQRG